MRPVGIPVSGGGVAACPPVLLRQNKLIHEGILNGRPCSTPRCLLHRVGREGGDGAPVPLAVVPRLAVGPPAPHAAREDLPNLVSALGFSVLTGALSLA